MKNVLFLSSWYPSRVHNTLGNFVSYHAKAVAKKNKVNVLYIVADDSIKSYEIEHFKSEKVTTTIVYFKRGLVKYYNYWVAFKKGWKFLTKEKKISFDLVHMNIMHPGIWQALYLKRKYLLPFIVSENWHGFQNLNEFKLGLFKKKLLKLGFKKAFSICPVSQQLKQSMIKGGFKANYKVIPNVVDTDVFQIEQVNNDCFTFLHVSTLDDSIKNVTGIISAFKDIKHENCQLRIIGDGPTNWIHKLVADYKIENRVIVEGEKTYSEIAKAMQQANVFVLFSNIENLPLVLIESMSTGTPFISTNVGGIPEIYDQNLGLMIEANDHIALVESMNSMINNFANYQPEIIRKQALKYFSYKKVGDQFDQLYSEMIGLNI